MSTSERVGRNEPCPCGSGRKYKVCCGPSQAGGGQGSGSPWTIVGVAAVALALAGSAFILMKENDVKASGTASRSMPMAPPIPGGIGGMPAGAPAPAPAMSVTTEPPGPAPEGKVWSPEHGHWHDAPGAATAAATPTVSIPGGGELVPIPPPDVGGTPAEQPPGPAPEGKVWSAEHGHWHDAPVVKVLPADPAAPPPAGTTDPK